MPPNRVACGNEMPSRRRVVRAGGTTRRDPTMMMTALPGALARALLCASPAALATPAGPPPPPIQYVSRRARHPARHLRPAGPGQSRRRLCRPVPRPARRQSARAAWLAVGRPRHRPDRARRADRRLSRRAGDGHHRKCALLTFAFYAREFDFTQAPLPPLPPPILSTHIPIGITATCSVDRRPAASISTAPTASTPAPAPAPAARARPPPKRSVPDARAARATCRRKSCRRGG